jgi:hypothetical protein
MGWAVLPGRRRGRRAGRSAANAVMAPPGRCQCSHGVGRQVRANRDCGARAAPRRAATYSSRRPRGRRRRREWRPARAAAAGGGEAGEAVGSIGTGAERRVEGRGRSKREGAAGAAAPSPWAALYPGGQGVGGRRARAAVAQRALGGSGAIAPMVRMGSGGRVSGAAARMVIEILAGGRGAAAPAAGAPTRGGRGGGARGGRRWPRPRRMRARARPRALTCLAAATRRRWG